MYSYLKKPMMTHGKKMSLSETFFNEVRATPRTRLNPARHRPPAVLDIPLRILVRRDDDTRL
jgi:hypothetical protein